MKYNLTKDVKYGNRVLTHNKVGSKLSTHQKVLTSLLNYNCYC
nr:MAG TPA: hypothetical protein [Caudoviricetes sp.]